MRVERVARIPARPVFAALARLGEQAGELVAPFVLDVERDRIGQVLLEQLGRLVGRVQRLEARLLGDREVELETLDPVHHAAAHQRRRLEQVIEHRVDEDDGQEDGDGKRRGDRAEQADADGLAREEGKREQRPADGRAVAAAHPGLHRLGDQHIAGASPNRQPDGHEGRFVGPRCADDDRAEREHGDRDADDEIRQVALEVLRLELLAQIALQRFQRALDLLVVYLIENDRVLAAEQFHAKLGFADREHRAVGHGAL